MLFQIILFLRLVGRGHRDDLADRNCGCARAIAVPVERLPLTPGPQPIARPITGCFVSFRQWPNSEKAIRLLTNRSVLLTNWRTSDKAACGVLLLIAKGRGFI